MVFHVIDDIELVGEIVVEVLRSEGFQATAWSDPVDYLNHVFSDGYIFPVAIFTDVQMPKINGYQLIERIREKCPDQKFILLSGYDAVREDMRSSVCHFLAKPFQARELIEIAQALIQCSQFGPSVANSTCVEILEERVKRCPLDCRECGNKPRLITEA